MTKEKMIELLNSDLMNEYKHMHFYLHSAVMIQGLHREEFREFLLKEAAGEMTHVQQFADVIVGLGGHPHCLPNDFPCNIRNTREILSYALHMEEEVVANYIQRMEDADKLGGVDGGWIHIFLEGQVQKSREDVDHLRQIVAGVN